jgi:glycosyltransferase involved in cell wall biosynthesis
MVSMNTRKRVDLRTADVVITGLQSWDIPIGSNCKNIARELAKDRRVLYVNPPLDRLGYWRAREPETIARFRERWEKGKDNPVEVAENLWVYYPPFLAEPVARVPVNMVFNWLNGRNNRRLAKAIQTAMSTLDFGPFWHFCDSDMFRSLHLKELLNPMHYTYYTRDNLTAVDYWQVQGTRIEPLHMAKADTVAANSLYLAQLAGRFNPHSYFVGQGCDLTAFKPETAGPVPADIAPITGPVIGYIGSLKALRLDLTILEHIARARTDWQLVLVGPEDDTFRASPLHDMPNVHFLGRKDESDLAGYLQAFDVAINPQRINEITRGNYPRKIDEYLAMGRATVATRTEAMAYFEEHVSLAEGPEEWVQAIESELASDGPGLQKERRTFASGHTWANNVEELFISMEKSRKL